MSPPEKKRKSTTTTKKPLLKKKNNKQSPQSTPNVSLSDDLLFSCLARVSRLYYPTLSLVSKSFRSLLASPELYKPRSLLGHTESCLYVCLMDHPEYHWFTLCRKPEQTVTSDTSKKRNESSGYVLVRVPMPHSPPAYGSSLVAVGSDIYKFGGHRSGFGVPSSSVSILDCRSHTWREAPSLRMELMEPSASVLDRKIYVAGRSKYGDSDSDSVSFNNFFQVLDTKTQIWDPEPIPCLQTHDDYYDKSACIDGKFHVVAWTKFGVAAYNSKEGRWDRVGPRMNRYMFPNSYCVIDNVLYTVLPRPINWCETDARLIKWYDSEARMWRKLNGLVGRPEFHPGTCVRLADYGGKLAVLNGYIVGSVR